MEMFVPVCLLRQNRSQTPPILVGCEAKNLAGLLASGHCNQAPSHTKSTVATCLKLPVTVAGPRWNFTNLPY